MNSSKNRCFVSFYYEAGDSLYSELLHILKISIGTFSNYDIIIYNEHDFNEYDIPSRDNFNNPYIYRWKYFSIKKCLESYDEVIWLDSDIIVNHKIDEIWEYFTLIDGFPILHSSRFSNYINPPRKDGVTDLKYSPYLANILDNFNCDTVVTEWKQACVLLFNKTCNHIIDELIYYLNIGVEDEHLLNLFYNYYKPHHTISGLFVCSHFFGVNILIHNMVRFDKSAYNNFMDTYVGYVYGENGLCIDTYGPMKLKIDNFDKILFWHGAKSLEVANRILIDVLKNKYQL